MSLNINTATKPQLMTIKGVGDILADRILWWQDNHGFDKLTDLMEVKGVKASIFSEAKDMGLHCMTQEEEKTMKAKEDIRALIRHLTMTFIMGFIHHGRGWTKRQVKMTSDLWLIHNKEKGETPALKEFDYIDMTWTGALDVAKVKFKEWKMEQTTTLYNELNWRPFNGTLKETAQNEAKAWAWALPNQGDNRHALMIEEMAYAILDDDLDKLADLKTQLHWVVVKRPQNMTSWKAWKLENLATVLVERISTVAEARAREIQQDIDADNVDEYMGRIDNLEDMVDGLGMLTPNDTEDIDRIHGQTKGFNHEPNWLHIYWKKEQAELFMKQFKKDLREMCHVQRNPSTRKEREEIARRLRQINNGMLMEVYFKKECKQELELMGNPLGFLTRAQLIELSQITVLCFKVLVPHWPHTPKVLIPYKDHMAAKGKGSEAEKLMAKREEKDNAEKEEHLRQREFSSGDYGKVNDEGEWSATDIVDERPNPEQQYVQAELWF